MKFLKSNHIGWLLILRDGNCAGVIIVFRADPEKLFKTLGLTHERIIGERRRANWKGSWGRTQIFRVFKQTVDFLG